MNGVTIRKSCRVSLRAQSFLAASEPADTIASAQARGAAANGAAAAVAGVAAGAAALPVPAAAAAAGQKRPRQTGSATLSNVPAMFKAAATAALPTGPFGATAVKKGSGSRGPAQPRQ